MVVLVVLDSVPCTLCLREGKTRWLQVLRVVSLIRAAAG